MRATDDNGRRSRSRSVSYDGGFPRTSGAPRRFEFILEASQVAPAKARHPFSETRAPRHSAVRRCRTSISAHVHHILGVRSEAQVAPSIVEPQTIAMVDANSRGRIKNEAMHED